MGKMPPRTRKRKLETEISDAGEPPTPTAKPTTRRQTRSRAKQARKEGGKTYDEGSARSKLFSHEVEAVKRRKLNAESAKEEIRDGLEDLMSFIGEQHKNKCPILDLGPALRGHLPPNCIPIMAPRHDGVSMRTGSRPTHNETFAGAFQVLKQLRESRKLYEALAVDNQGIKRPEWMYWEQDQKDLKGLNQYAMATAARTINSLIVPNPKPLVSGLPKKAGVVEKVAWEIFDKVRPTRTENTWGRVAQEQVKAFAGILRSMQGD